MPINLDSCITGIFVPGNIGASSGLPPVVRVVPPREPTSKVAAIIEVAVALDMVAGFAPIAAAMVEAATANDAADATITAAPLVSRAAMLPGVFVNSPGTVRQANANGIMANL